VRADPVGHVVATGQTIGAVDMPVPNDLQHILIGDLVDITQ
jgi:hypothetical protein